MRYILKDKIQAPGSCLDNIEELHHVWVVQLSQQRYLANHIAWYTSLWRRVGKWNLFDCHQITGVECSLLIVV